ncbi:aromatic ring-hydroxylating dioxygenase subunit alpha [Ammoniphilus sp. YIM 78166]|uniref:aromatic ring-hydroxylating dioxygenase subunit alpha n=1 Tax=Ammoniphilus sp. YIM 78166 TaxID=1644106 RepID=UPI00106FE5E8|nr:aromatic ring-hydroxylating dioxygenase subunit alpha [Ammoniphilus sp. YIM 78166]
MLTREQNDTLTQVGPGTPMGELLRKYWFPIGAVSELETKPTKKVKLLGEDLVLYKDRSGNYGLVQERCPHRGVSMVYGIPEEDGLRCQYHGWCFNKKGQCTEQPNEPADSTFKNRIKIKAYPVESLGGLLFAYLGPEPAPLLPKYDLFVREDVIRTIGYAVIPCNFFQIMENSLDPVHLEWLHGRYFEHVFEQQNKDVENWYISKHHVKIGFDVFKHGIIKRRLLEGQTEDCDGWKIGHPVVFPNMLRVGDGAIHSFQIRVPMDDKNTYHLWYSCFIPGEGVEIPKDYPITYWEAPLTDEHGELVTDYIDGQDAMAWVTQGEIADRTEEKLGTSDKGIIMYRQLCMEQIRKVENGEDPMNVFRNPEENENIELPQEHDIFMEGPMLFKVAKEWNTRYAPNIDEILDILKKKKSPANVD